MVVASSQKDLLAVVAIPKHVASHSRDVEPTGPQAQLKKPKVRHYMTINGMKILDGCLELEKLIWSQTENIICDTTYAYTKERLAFLSKLQIWGSCQSSARSGLRSCSRAYMEWGCTVTRDGTIHAYVVYCQLWGKKMEKQWIITLDWIRISDPVADCWLQTLRFFTTSRTKNTKTHQRHRIWPSTW